MAQVQRSVPFFLWPVVAIWRLLTFVIVATGRLVCAVLGIVLMLVGVLLTVTVAGAPFGIPLTFVGGLLLIRALF